MADVARIREIIEHTVTEVFATEVAGLRDRVIQRVVEHLQPALAQPLGGTRTDQLKFAVAAIHEATAQSDILRALLDGVAAFCGRAAVFVVRGNSASGWQGRGFREDDAVKRLTLDLNTGLAAQCFQQRAGAEGPVGQFHANFAAGFGAPPNGNCLLVPLLIRDKVAALIYADGGAQTAGGIDAAALHVLARTAGTWIELLALRKSAAAQVSPSAPPISGAAFDAEPIAAEPLRPGRAGAVAAPVAAPASEDDEEVHRKARRFAKLLVDEIKLYNQAKLIQGKQNRDLYDRLKDDIEKSRATYESRYARTSAAGADYFTQELISNLADNNPNLLGGNFPR